MTSAVDPETGKTVITFTFDTDFLDPQEITDPMDSVFKGDLSTLADDGGLIEIICTAKLTADAVKMDITTFENSAIVRYSGDAGNNPTWTDGNEDKTETHTYGLDLLKYIQGTESDPSALAGAKFVLYHQPWNTTAFDYADGNITVNSGTMKGIDTFDSWLDAGADIDDEELTVDWWNGYGVMYFTRESAGSKTEPAVYVPVMYDGGDPGNDWVYEMVTPASGKIVNKGLNAGLYAFGETVTPDGYNKLDDPVPVVIGDTVIDKGGKVFQADTANRNGDTVFRPLVVKTGETTADSIEVKVANASGLRMPDTGGIGTTIFYVVGGTLALAAGALLIVKKRVGGHGREE